MVNPMASDISTSGLTSPTLGSKSPTSDSKSSISDMKSPTSDVESPASDLKSPINIAEYLFRRLYEVGIRAVHGVPGDYSLGET